jgi:hypothetical protein
VLLVGTPKSARFVRTVPLPLWLAAQMAGYLAEHPLGGDTAAPLFPNRVQTEPGARANARRHRSTVRSR